MWKGQEKGRTGLPGLPATFHPYGTARGTRGIESAELGTRNAYKYPQSFSGSGRGQPGVGTVEGWGWRGAGEAETLPGSTAARTECQATGSQGGSAMLPGIPRVLGRGTGWLRAEQGTALSHTGVTSGWQHTALSESPPCPAPWHPALLAPLLPWCRVKGVSGLCGPQSGQPGCQSLRHSQGGKQGVLLAAPLVPGARLGMLGTLEGRAASRRSVHQQCFVLPYGDTALHSWDQDMPSYRGARHPHPTLSVAMPQPALAQAAAALSSGTR